MTGTTGIVHVHAAERKKNQFQKWGKFASNPWEYLPKVYSDAQVGHCTADKEISTRRAMANEKGQETASAQHARLPPKLAYWVYWFGELGDL